MNEVGDTLERMNAVQLVAALLFVAGYVVSLGQLATDRGRRWGAGTAFVAAVVFVAFTRPWEHGVILVALASSVVALFVAVAWAFNRYFERRHAALATERELEDIDTDDAGSPTGRNAGTPSRPPVGEPASSH